MSTTKELKAVVSPRRLRRRPYCEPKPSPAWEAKCRADKAVSKALQRVLLDAAKLATAMAERERAKSTLDRSLGHLPYTPYRRGRRRVVTLGRNPPLGKGKRSDG